VSGYRRSDTAATIVERADGALYKAKQSGKNCAFSETDL
jgi:PleD family two-component response regulator